MVAPRSPFGRVERHRAPRVLARLSAVLIPVAVPVTRGHHAGGQLRSRWSRTRGLLLFALIASPWALVVLCAGAVTTAAAVGGFTAWLPVPVLLSAAVAVAILATTGRLVFEPPRWARVAALAGGGQLVLGVFPAVGLAVGAGGVATTVATAVLVLSLVVVVTGVVVAARAMRTLLTPVSPELGATPFTVTLRARLHDTGLVSGSVSVSSQGIEWAARRHRAVGAGSVHFRDLRDARPTTVAGTAAVGWLSLSDGTAAHALPGPGVLLDIGSTTVLLPVDDPELFVALLSSRVAAWRSASPG